MGAINQGSPRQQVLLLQGPPLYALLYKSDVVAAMSRGHTIHAPVQGVPAHPALAWGQPAWPWSAEGHCWGMLIPTRRPGLQTPGGESGHQQTLHWVGKALASAGCCSNLIVQEPEGAQLANRRAQRHRFLLFPRALHLPCRVRPLPVRACRSGHPTCRGLQMALTAPWQSLLYYSVGVPGSRQQVEGPYGGAETGVETAPTASIQLCWT